MTEITPEIARTMIDKIYDNWERLEFGIEMMIEQELWIPLGYETFAKMWDAEGFNKFKLSAPVRQSAIERMRTDTPEISNRKLAKLTGVDEKTIRNDQKRQSADYSAPQDSPIVGQIVDKADITHCPGCRCEK